MKMYKAILMLLLLLVVSCILFLVVKFSTVKIICPMDVDEPKLSALSVALTMYENDYGVFPPEEDFGQLLLDRNIIAKEDVLYSGHGNILLRYFRHEDKFVLVGPGKNKKYDTPEGYENIKEFREKSDDIIRFSK